jgi:Flp pilus assembly protein TadG
MRRSRRGAQAVEFALSLPMLFVLLAGIADYGWYYSRSLSVVEAARDGARAGAAQTTMGNVCTTARTAAQDSLVNAGFPTGQTVNAACSTFVVGGTTYYMVEVTAKPTYSALMLPSSLVPNLYFARTAFKIESTTGVCTCSI